MYDSLGTWVSGLFGGPFTAHRNRAALFDDETLYRAMFNEDTDVRNMLFAYRIDQTLSVFKDDLHAKVKGLTEPNDESVLYSYFQYGAFALDVIDMCSSVLDSFLTDPEPDYKTRVTLPDKLIKTRSSAIESLRPLVGLILPPLQQLLATEADDAYRVLRTRDSVERLTAGVRTQVEMYRNTNEAGFNATLPDLELIK